MNSKIYLFLVAVMLIGFSGRAQDDSLTFSLEEAQSYAMENSYVLRNTKMEIDIAQKRVWEAISTGLPQVDGTANYNMFLNLPVSLIPAEFFGGEPGEYYPVKFGQDFNSDFGFVVSQLIFDGSYIIGVGSSRIYLNLSSQAHEKMEIDIREAVTQAYYMVLTGIEYKNVMDENLKNAQSLFDETKIYYENGFREEQDVDQLKLLLRNAENEVLRAEREISIAKTVLKYAMGYDLDKEIFVEDDIQTFIMPLVNKQNTLYFNFNEHIDYRIAMTNFQLSEKLMKLEKVAYLPKLSGFYNYTKTSYGNEANLFSKEWYPSSMIGFQLSMPIFNSGSKRAKVQQAQLKLEQAITDQRLTETTLQKDYLTAQAEMKTALEAYENTSENRELARSIRDKTTIKFNNGISGSTELSQTETQYIDAYRALVASTLQLLQADLKLKKSTGAL